MPGRREISPIERVAPLADVGRHGDQLTDASFDYGPFLSAKTAEPALHG